MLSHSRHPKAAAVGARGETVIVVSDAKRKTNGARDAGSAGTRG